MKSPSSKKILIIDDEQDVRETLSEALELCGYESTVVSGGEEALKVLSGPEKPALILLDLMMPGMDGFEFMKLKDETLEITDIPTVVISASGRIEIKLAEFKAQGYLQKPINLDDLLEVAEKYCS